jgi:pimeloyl-ACP methyl ester carboxylesterase
MTLAHDVAGTGSAVLLLHSSVCDRRMWDVTLPALVEAGLRVVRCDLPGYGETPVPEQPYNDADEVLRLLDALDLDRTAVVGASFGGRVALEIAARWPDRVTALVLLCTAVAALTRGPELEAFGAREDELLEAGDVAGATELNVQTWLGPHADESTRERVRTMQRHAFEVQLAAPDVTPIRVPHDLSGIPAPSLVVSGRHDLVDFQQVAVRVAEQIGGRHVELDWAGHLPSLERPDVVNALLVEFLRDAGRDSAPSTAAGMPLR